MTTFYAQPYDICAEGFYFSCADELRVKSSDLRNEFGDPVEEFEIQFIEGEAIDAELASALNIHQGNVGRFIALVDEWGENEKRILTIAARELGEVIHMENVDSDEFEIHIYEGLTMRDLAEQFVDEGLFGDIPDQLECYIDYDAIARDLAMDYTETEIAGVRLIYRSV